MANIKKDKENVTINTNEIQNDVKETNNDKTLNAINISDVQEKVSDVEVYGDGDTFALLCKASSKIQGWMKSTKVCNVHGGCIVQVSTQQKNPDGSYSVAEALTFVPNVKIDTSVEPRKLTTC